MGDTPGVKRGAVMVEVQLLMHTPLPDDMAYTAYRQCYSADKIQSLLQCDAELVSKLINKHESPLEHISFTFAINGISRACSHQLVRHRISSISQKSQRYVAEKQFEYTTPETIKSFGVEANYTNLMKSIQQVYNELVDAGVPKEDARYVLPNACNTSLIHTFNVRSLYNLFTLRCCERAQWEIRTVAKEMLNLAQQVSPLLFQYAGPACKRGKCLEGEMSCQNNTQKEDRKKRIKQSIKERNKNGKHPAE